MSIEATANTTTVAKLKKGQYFKRIRKDQPTQKTYTRSEYVREAKAFQCDDHDDIWGNGVLLKGSTVVATGFTY